MISSVAIGVAAGIGALIVIFLFVRFYLWSRRRSSSNPLPPVQMLAHQRIRQQETFLFPSNYAADLQALSPAADSPSASTFFKSSSETPRTSVSHFTSGLEAPQLPQSIISCASSREEIISSDDRPNSRTPSLRHISARSSISSMPSLRGPPHKRATRMEIVLPTPLASEQNAHHSQRFSTYDQWTPPLSRSTSKIRSGSESGEQSLSMTLSNLITSYRCDLD